MTAAFFAALRAFLGSLFGRLFSRPGTRQDPQLTEEEHALAAKQREAEVFSAPLPDDAALDGIVREHNRQS